MLWGRGTSGDYLEDMRLMFYPDGEAVVAAEWAFDRYGRPFITTFDTRTGKDASTDVHIEYSQFWDEFRDADIWDGGDWDEFWDARVRDLATPPHGGPVALVSSEDVVRLFSADGSQELLALENVSSDVAFSPDDHTLAAGFQDGTAGLWDARTGRKIINLSGNIDPPCCATFSADSRSVSAGRVWDVELGQEKVVPESNSRDVDTDRLIRSLREHPFHSRSGERMATVSATGTARLWDVSNGRKLQEFETGWDQRQAMASGDRPISRFGWDAISDVHFSLGVRKLAVRANDGPTRLWDLESGRELLALDGPVTDMAFGEHGHMFMLSVDGAPDAIVGLRDPGTDRQFLTVTEPGILVVHVDARVIVTDTDGDGVSGWKLLTLNLEEACSASGTRIPHVLAPDGRTLAVGFNDGTVRLWDVHSGRLTHVLEAHTRFACNLSFSPDGTTLFTSSLGSDVNGRLWDVATGRVLWSSEFFFKYAEYGSEYFSPNGQFIVLQSQKSYLILSAETGEQVWGEGWGSFVRRNLWFSRDGNTLVAIGSDDGSHTNPGIVKNLVTGEEYLLDDTRPNEDIDFSPDGRTIATIPGESLWLSDAATGRARAEFLSFSDGSWIVRTPEGFFNASEGGAKHLILVRGFDTLSIDQVHDALYRPDLVREALAGDPDGKVAAAAARLDLDKVVASGFPPRIVALTSLDGDSVAGDAVEMSAELEVRSGGVGRVEWRVNGIVQGTESRGLSRPAAPSQEAARLHKRLFLVPGENVVSVTVYNEANLIASDPVEIVVTSTWTEVPRPKLHVLAAGVNDYFDSHLALNYATSDARAIGQALKRAGHGLYDSVEVTYLLDREVSADGLTSAFERLGREVRPQDVFVFFLAGHGKTVDGRYYFLPRDFRFRDIEDLTQTSISQDQLQSWVAQVSAQKSVLLLDTCESGSLTMEAVSRGLERKTAIDRLSRAVGRTILTASTDTQPALEGFRQHGLFTWTLLEAFAAADTDGDGEVEINELIGYVDERLPVLSEAAFGYRQVPQYKSRGNIFPLGRSVELVSETGRLIPRTPTHVVIRETEVLEDYNDPESVIDAYVPGVTVRVVERSGDWVLIAVDGVGIGWTETARLATLQ